MWYPFDYILLFLYSSLLYWWCFFFKEYFDTYYGYITFFGLNFPDCSKILTRYILDFLCSPCVFNSFLKIFYLFILIALFCVISPFK